MFVDLWRRGGGFRDESRTIGAGHSLASCVGGGLSTVVGIRRSDESFHHFECTRHLAGELVGGREFGNFGSCYGFTWATRVYGVRLGLSSTICFGLYLCVRLLWHLTAIATVIVTSTAAVPELVALTV
jgi:hypothetical protein